MQVDPTSPVALLYAAIIAVSGVVGLLYRGERARTDQVIAAKDAQIAYLINRILIGDQREEAWRDEAKANSALGDRQMATIDDVLSELKAHRQPR